jgi:hypothetical protein
VPDGTLYFREISSNSISLRLQINDMYLSEYHANNGITKITFKLDEMMAKKSNQMASARKNLKNKSGTWPVN